MTTICGLVATTLFAIAKHERKIAVGIRLNETDRRRAVTEANPSIRESMPVEMFMGLPLTRLGPEAVSGVDAIDAAGRACFFPLVRETSTPDAARSDPFAPASTSRKLN